MSGTVPLITSGFPIADTGPGFLVFAGGSLVTIIAGLFLSVAIVAGGLWLIRRSQKRPPLSAPRYFWFFLGVALCIGALAACVFALFDPAFLALAGAMLVLGVLSVRSGVKARTGYRPAAVAMPPSV